MKRVPERTPVEVNIWEEGGEQRGEVRSLLESLEHLGFLSYEAKILLGWDSAVVMDRRLIIIYDNLGRFLVVWTSLKIQYIVNQLSTTKLNPKPAS